MISPIPRPRLLSADYGDHRSPLDCRLQPARRTRSPPRRMRMPPRRRSRSSLIGSGPRARKRGPPTSPIPMPSLSKADLLLLTPLSDQSSKLAGLAAAHQLTHASFLSFRPWIEEGLAHFAQALYLEQQKGRQAALDYMGAHRSQLDEAEKTTSVPRSEEPGKELAGKHDQRGTLSQQSHVRLVDVARHGG